MVTMLAGGINTPKEARWDVDFSGKINQFLRVRRGYCGLRIVQSSLDLEKLMNKT